MRYQKIYIILFLLLATLVINSQQDYTPATQSTRTLSSSSRPISTVPAYVNTPDPFKFVRSVQHLTHKAISIIEHTWSEVRKWTTTRLSNTSAHLALPPISALAVSSALKSGAQLVKECGNDIVDYCHRTYRYLKAAKDYERSLYEKSKGEDITQQNLDPLVAATPSRKDIINKIAIRAGLRPEEIPYLALVLERVVRSSGKWTHGVSMWAQDLWQRPLRHLRKFMVHAAFILVGMASLSNGRIWHWSAWLVGIMILIISDKISTWLVSIG